MQKSHNTSPLKPILSLSSLSCKRGSRILFQGLGISLLTHSGLLIVGPNGSGKTTFLRALAGLSPAISGKVEYYPSTTPDEQSTAITNPQHYCSEALYIGHKNALKPDATVLDMLSFWAKTAGDPALLSPAIEYFGLLPYLDRHCGQLSAGWKRRVALSRLLLIPARLWILDEPMSNLDDDGVRLTQGLIQSRVNSGGCVIMAAHGAHISFASSQKESGENYGFQILDIGDFH